MKRPSRLQRPGGRPSRVAPGPRGGGAGGSAIEYVAVGTVANNALGTSNWNITPPSHSEGDILVLAIAGHDDIFNQSTPAGWTAIDSASESGVQDCMCRLFAKVAGASEGAVSFQSNFAFGKKGVILAFSGATTIEDTSANGLDNQATTTPPIAGGTLPGSAGSMVIHNLASAQNTFTYAEPGVYTQVVEEAEDGSYPYFSVSYYRDDASAPDGTISGTAGGTREYCSTVCVLS